MVDPAKNLSYNITIQCSLDGFCFVLHDASENKIIDLGLYQTAVADDESVIMEAIEKAVFKRGLSGKPLLSARYIADNRQSVLVPEPLFDAEHQEQYFLFNHALPAGYSLRHERIPSLQAVNVFAVPTRHEARLRGLWDNLQTTHRSTVFLNAILREETGDEPVKAHVNVSSRSFDLAVINEGRLVFFNNFKFNSKDDFVYYLMFALEQQPFGQDVPVYFSGLITSHSEIYELCERYIKRMRIVRPDGHVEVDMSLNDTPFHYYYIPYQSLSCAL